MVSYAHDGPSRSPYFDSNCRNLQVSIFNSQNHRIWAPDQIGGLIYSFPTPYTPKTQHCITMNRGRAAPSARSDTSDMDSEGTGNVMLDMNNSWYSPICLRGWNKYKCMFRYSNRIRNYQIEETVEDHGRRSACVQLSNQGEDPQTRVSERCLLCDFFLAVFKYSILNWLRIDWIMMIKAGDW